MPTWFTADLHLGHHNIIGYCDRPFADVESMDRALVERWNEVVAPDDTVWVLGDFALGRIAQTLPLAAELSGRKILVAGNHDRCWYGHGRRARRWLQRYLDAGFATVHQDTTTIELAGQSVLLCHFPYEGDSHDHDRFTAYRPEDHGGIVLHGHVHDRWAQHGRMINVGVDVHDYRPVSEHDVVALMPPC